MKTVRQELDKLKELRSGYVKRGGKVKSDSEEIVKELKADGIKTPGAFTVLGDKDKVSGRRILHKLEWDGKDIFYESEVEGIPRKKFRLLTLEEQLFAEEHLPGLLTAVFDAERKLQASGNVDLP